MPTTINNDSIVHAHLMTTKTQAHIEKNKLKQLQKYLEKRKNKK